MKTQVPICLGQISASGTYNRWRLYATAALASMCVVIPLAGNLRAGTDLFPPPTGPKPADEVLLVSTRKIGTTCNHKSMTQGLRCQRVFEGKQGEVARADLDWRYLEQGDQRPVIIYIHGNRVSPGHDEAEGLAFYRSFKQHCKFSEPVRFIIFSWPASQIPGPIKDYLVKAQRTNPVAWQLAWLIDRMPHKSPTSLVGYSYGARVASGASHLLAGGAIGPLKLTDRVHRTQPPLRLALIAAAFDANWIQPGEYFSRTLPQSERVILGVNKLDPAMRFYHLSNGMGRMHALGKSGVHQPARLQSLGARVQQLDFSEPVGRSHMVTDYLAAEQQMSRIWRELLLPSTSHRAATAHQPPNFASVPSSVHSASR